MIVIDRSEVSECNSIDHDILQIKFEVHLNKEIVICGASKCFELLNRSAKLLNKFFLLFFFFL